MIYCNNELKADGFDHIIAMQRYLYKYINHKKEFHRLKAHEKDYAFGWMNATYDDKGKKAFNLYEDVEAYEYVFCNIILTYGEDIASFNGNFNGPNGKIPDSQVQKDKVFFKMFLQIWKKNLSLHKGPYLSIIAPMFQQKMKELKIICKTEQELLSREIYCYGVFFYIYYKAKLYFDEKVNKSIIFEVNGYSFVANIYTYCHILNRHYIPSLNRGLSNTMNNNLSMIDINSLLESMRDLIVKYFSVCSSLQPSKEFLLFKINGDKYILWIKYKKLDELSKLRGFEVRSFYRCEDTKDISLYDNTIDIEIENSLMCSIPKRINGTGF